MNNNGILYQSLSIAVIIHLALALIFSHTTIWDNIVDMTKKDDQIMVDLLDPPDEPAPKTNIPKDASKGVRKPPVPETKAVTPAEEPRPEPERIAKATPVRPVPVPMTPPPVPQQITPPAPQTPSAAPDMSEKVDSPSTRSDAATNPDGSYSDGPDLSNLPTLPKRIVQPTVEDMMRYAKVDKEPAEKSAESTITMDTDDLKYTSYMLGLKRRIETIWQYPETSRRSGEQGELIIRFVIAKSGKLEEAEILKSSGYPMLDQAATKALHDASPFNPLPDNWGEERFQITGNFIYSLYDFYVR